MAIRSNHGRSPGEKLLLWMTASNACRRIAALCTRPGGRWRRRAVITVLLLAGAWLGLAGAARAESPSSTDRPSSSDSSQQDTSYSGSPPRTTGPLTATTATRPPKPGPTAGRTKSPIAPVAPPKETPVPTRRPTTRRRAMTTQHGDRTGRSASQMTALRACPRALAHSVRAGRGSGPMPHSTCSEHLITTWAPRPVQARRDPMAVPSGRLVPGARRPRLRPLTSPSRCDEQVR